jgi:hypothetical protein
MIILSSCLCQKSKPMRKIQGTNHFIDLCFYLSFLRRSGYKQKLSSRTRIFSDLNPLKKMTETKGPSVLQKFFALNSKPTHDTFPELPDAIVWMRFVLALCYGAWLGIANQRGGSGVLFGLNCVTFVPILYCSTVR